MLRAERQHHGVVVGRGLQFEVERAAEAFAQRQTQPAVQAPPVGAVDHELHAAGLVEEALDDQPPPRGQRAQSGPGRGEVRHDGLGGNIGDAAPLGDGGAGGVGVTGDEELLDQTAQVADLVAQLRGAGGSLAQPERHRGRRALGVDHPHDAGLDAPDAPTVRPQEEHVAGHGFDGPVLVDRPEERVVGVEQHAVVGHVRDRSAGGQRGQARATAPRGLAGRGVHVDVVAAATAPGGDAGVHETERLVEVGARQVRVGSRPAYQLEQGLDLPALGGALGGDLLRQHVEGRDGWGHRIEPPGSHPGQQRGALHELVAGRGEQAPLGHGTHRVARAADPLQERGHAAGTADLARQIDRADIDAQLQRGGGHERAQVAGPEPGLHAQAAFLRERAVMGGHVAVAQPFGQQVGDALGLAPGVDEYQRCVVRLDQLRDPVEDLSGLFGRRHGLQLARRQLESQIQLAPVADIDHRRSGPGRAPVAAGDIGSARADEQSLDRGDGALRGRQSDPQRRPLADVRQPLQAQRQVRAALVAGHRVDLVHDHPSGRPQHLPAARRGQQEVQGLGRGDDEVGRVAQHRGPGRRGGVAGADRHTQWRRFVAHLAGDLLDLGERAGEVLADVGGEGLQGRHVDHLGLPGHRLAPLVGLPEGVDGHEERRQGLARPGGGAHERVDAGSDGRPGAGLRGRRPGREALLEPGADRGMEAGQDVGGIGSGDVRSGGDGGHGDSWVRPAPGGPPGSGRTHR